MEMSAGTEEAVNLYKMLRTARSLAEEKHFGQKDLRGEDYIGHVYQVSLPFKEAVLGMIPLRTKKAIVAWLHDILEDTDVTVNDLRELGFTEDIIEAVVAMTHVKGERYTDYIIRVGDNEIARDVKKADLTHNMDLHRIAYNFKNPSRDMKRIEKYIRAYEYLFGRATKEEYLNQ